jgi:hypothetical protein
MVATGVTVNSSPQGADDQDVLTLLVSGLPSRVVSDRASDLVVTVSLWVAVVAALTCVWFLWKQERSIRTLTKEFGVDRHEVRRAVRSRSLGARPPVVPTDPYARTHHVVVAPLGDGRPGESFWGPGENRATGDPDPNGCRVDVGVVLAKRTHLLVVCLGRLGTRLGDVELRPAAERVQLARESLVPPQASIGPVDRVDSALGVGWRLTVTFGGEWTLTDTHVDHDGWAFIIAVVSTSSHARAVEALDGILSTWQWIPDRPAG